MKLSNLKTIVYVGLALFYLYIIATNVFRNVEGMTTTIETIENKKEAGRDGDSMDASAAAADENGKNEKKSESKKEGETNMGNSDSEGSSKKESTNKKKNEDKNTDSKPMQPSTSNSSNEDK